MKNVLLKISTLLFVVFVFSCKNHKSPYYDEILKSEEGHFRGAQIGSAINYIKQLENDAFLIDEMYDYLHYDYEINMGNTYTVTYDFSEKNEIYEIEVAIFLDVVEEAKPLFKNFMAYFNRKYGVGVEESDGYMTWSSTSTLTSSDVEISMINDSREYGFITIFIRDLSY